ncbi:MAG TPA: hypothetical protein VFV38_28415 [Ktedonobacteraceae bacterium]|nr:hypothetical protein [Ktedonobacteraceae bacterium]
MNDTSPAAILRIPKTLQILSLCWEQAEKAVQKIIMNDLPGTDEETITLLFYVKFAEQLREVSSKKIFAKAFLIDLVNNFPDLAHMDLGKIAEGLVADVTLHKRATEKITGGDLGLMIVRPQVTHSSHVLKIGDYRRGILCQAKLKGKTGRWGKFTQRQRLVLPERMSYLSLLLYSYTDAQRHNLRDFQWYMCSPVETFEQLEAYVNGDTFPRLYDSKTIINAIGSGNIGTDDDDILDQFVSPKKNSTLIINISWPDRRSNTPDGLAVYVHATQNEEIRQIHARSQQMHQQF